MVLTKLSRPRSVRSRTLLGNACGNCNVVPIAVLLVLGSRRRCNHRLDLATRVLPPQIGCKNPGTETVLASQRNMVGRCSHQRNMVGRGVSNMKRSRDG